MGAGKKKLERALSAFSNSKISKPNLVPGALGGYIDGYQQIQVSYRQDFVYVRLRTTDSETIQAFNDKVGIHWDLPILVYRDPESPGVWRVYGRDIRAYDDWEGVAYSNPHAESHSFAGAAKTGADVVWTFKRQYMPLLMHPSPTGTMGVYIEPDFYVYQGQVKWWPGSGSASLASLKPTGSFTGRFITVYLDNAGVPAFLGGDEFSAIDVPTDPSTYIRIPSTTQGVPLGAVLLLTGTEYIGWGEIYDLRLPNQAVFPMSDVSGSLMFYDEATLLGSAARLNVTGERLTVRVSGSYATIHASPDPVEQIGVFNVIAPPGSAVGTGTVIEWGDNLSVTISGTTVHVDATAGGGGHETGTIVIYDENTFLGVFEEMRFLGAGVDAYNSGSYAAISIPGGGGATVNSDGIMAWDEGIPMGTGSIINFRGPNVVASISGTVIDVYVSGSSGGGGGHSTGTMVIYDEDAFVGVFEEMRFKGGGVNVYNSGSYASISIPSQTYSLAGSYQIDELIYEVALTSATGSIIVPGIPQGYDHLYWEMQGRGDYGAGTDTDVAVRLNADNTAGNYRRISHVALDGTHNTFSADSNVGIVSIPCVGGIANSFGWSKGEIPYYALTGAHHLIQAWSQERRAASASIILTVQTQWELLAAVNQVSFHPVSGSFAIGTRFRLYGRKNSPLPAVMGGVDQIGVYGLDEGAPLGTGTWMNFRGPNVVASISGTVIDVYVSGSSLTVLEVQAFS